MHMRTHTEQRQEVTGTFLVFDIVDPDPGACTTEDVWGRVCARVWVCACMYGWRVSGSACVGEHRAEGVKGW